MSVLCQLNVLRNVKRCRVRWSWMFICEVCGGQGGMGTTMKSLRYGEGFSSHYDNWWKTELELTLKEIFLGQLTAASKHCVLVGLEHINQPINQSWKRTWVRFDVCRRYETWAYFNIYTGLCVLFAEYNKLCMLNCQIVTYTYIWIHLTMLPVSHTL
jgi:hypothetical protein